MDADAGHRRRPRRGARADSRQRGGRARHLRDDDRRAGAGGDPSSLLPQWQDSVVALWTPTAHASGFVVDAKGLIATNQRVIGTATSVEVQLTPAVKVAANVLAADPVRDVAVLWIDPKVARHRCGPCRWRARRRRGQPVAEGQELFAIGAPLRGPKRMTSGTVSRVEPHAIVSDLRLATGSAGGPVFGAGGDVIGITTLGTRETRARRGDSRVVRVTRRAMSSRPRRKR